MSDKKFSTLLWILTQGLVEKIMETKSLDFHKATEMLLKSQTYSMLEEKENDLWQFSNIFLYRVFDNELVTHKFEMPDVIL
jgi:ligand-binding sensor domain-containing protein